MRIPPRAWHTPPIRTALLLLLVVATLSINFPLLLPILATQRLGAGSQIYGLISACFGVGALVGALLTAAMGRSTWPLLLGSMGGFGLALLLLAPQQSLPAVIAMLIVTGAGLALYTATSNALVQFSTPDHLQGRVLGLYSYIFIGTAVPGALLTGWLSQVGGATLALVVAGAAAVLMAGIGLAWYLAYRRTAR